MNNRKLIDYLPPVLKSVSELVALYDAQQPEIEKAWSALRLIMDNQFIDTATEYGVTVWEKELNIIPSDTDTLEERKHRIKTAWVYGVVYTYNWLSKWLESFCGETTMFTINDYTLRVALPVSADYVRIIEDMRKYISANVLINPLILLTKIKGTYYIGTALRSRMRHKMTSQKPSDTLLLVDENSNVLVDENGKLLVETF